MTIRETQDILDLLGYALSNDGQAGPLTRQAVLAFQRDAGLAVDGIWGPASEAAARSWVAAGKRRPAEQAPQEPAKAPTTEPTQSGSGAGIYGSRYFTKPELACKCGGVYCNGYPAEISRTLVTVADRVREHFNRPMTPTSTLRCPRHNAKEGGVANSKHTRGLAMDFRIPGVSADEILAYVKQQPEISYSYHIPNTTCVHMDVNY